jgi:hypothetical protein
MASRAVMKNVVSLWRSPGGIAVLVAVTLAWLAPGAFCKEPSLTAIELYDGPAGAAYVQLAEVLINGKAELRDCSQSQGTSIDKSAYGKLPKITLTAGDTLDRGPDGILRYSTTGRTAICVVPANFKFEHSANYSLSDLVEQSALRGTPIAPSSAAGAEIPPLKKGVKLVFVAAPNVELAEFLRGQRATEIESWRTFLTKYPASSHIGEAKLALATLYVAAGEKSLAAYRGSAGAAAPTYSDLKDAKTQASLAIALLPSLDAAAKLNSEIRTQLAALTDAGQSELDAYHAALVAQGPGYVHLQTAKKLSDAVTGVDSEFAPGQVLMRAVLKESGMYESALHSATTLTASNQPKEMEQAAKTVQAYRAFRAEDPRLAAVIDAIYSFHMQHGAEAATALDWPSAVAEFQKAGATKDTKEAQDSLKNAQEQLVVARNAAAAKAALQRSSDAEQQHDMIRAYEELSNLPLAQQALVADDMKRLAPAYVLSAAQKASDLRKAHVPIQGIGDGYEMENAYTYLQHAFDLSQDEKYQDQMGVLGDELSTYFLAQANHYLEKPEGSGTELGWAYLQEAISYKASNQAAVRDARVGAELAHAMHSRLSIQVQFRDGTSQRDSAGFAGQLENAILRGLETSSITIKAVKFGESATAKPDFQLIGDVLEHHISVTPNPETMESTYFAGMQDTPNEEWNKADRDYVNASNDLTTAQSALQGAEAKGNKKAIDESNNRVSLAKKGVSDALLRRDTMSKDIKTPINHPYTYTKNTYEFKDAIQLQFRIGETLTGQMTEFVPIAKEDHKQVVVLEGVKAEDAKGVKPAGTLPDRTEMLAGLENEARDALIEAVRSRVESLPKSIYENGKKKEIDGDMEGAAEAYLRFLNCTREEDSAERTHARDYLKSQFHLRPDPGVSP